MQGSSVLILGCGFTGERVARTLLSRGVSVKATSRDPRRLASLKSLGAAIRRMDVLEPETLVKIAPPHPSQRLAVLHSIPVVRGPHGDVDPTPALLETLGGSIGRIVYLSTTGVYGDTFHVDETTRPAPRGRSAGLRVSAERAVLDGPWSALVLRPAAIYGPGRGVHESMRKGVFRLAGAGDNYVSRIHVDDLAAITTAALLSRVTGAFPVADDDPCTSSEMAHFCAELLGVDLPPAIPASEAHRTRRANRRVDGSAIRRILGVDLRYPSYRTGVPAALQAASAQPPPPETLE